MPKSKPIKMVDPASGWRYGFPKAVPDGITDEGIYAWLIDQGVTEEDAKHIRFFYQEEDEDNGTDETR